MPDDTADVELRAVDPASAPAVAAVRLYLEEIARRLEQGFDVDAALAADVESRHAAPWVFVLATSDGEPVACGGVRRLHDHAGAEYAEIKRMWVHDAWRGAGLGRRLMGRLEDEAASLGLTTVRLDTHRSLVEAVRIYERSGYRRIARYNDNRDAQAWFEKRLIPQA